jgi:hypothetical protein
MYVAIFFSCLTGRHRPNSPPDALPALCRMPLVGEVEQSTPGDGLKIAVTIIFIKPNTNLLEFRASANMSSSKKRNTLYYQYAAH